MNKTQIACDADREQVYANIDITVAVVLVVVSMVSAEIPRHRVHLTAPYMAAGWRPSGQQFSLPLRTKPQPYSPIQPQTAYGPPKEAEVTTEAPTTTTEAPTTTETPPKTKVERLAAEAAPKDVEKLEEPHQPKERQFYVVVPQRQSLVYGAHPQRAALVARGNLLARLQTLPPPAVSSAVFTPFSASYVQIYH